MESVNGGAKKTVSGVGADFAITVTRAESGGVVGVFEAVAPIGNGPPIHVHANEDETLHVIEGTYEFWVDGEVFVRTPGTTIFLPRGVPHTFRVVGDVPGRSVTALTPGGFEAYFLEVENLVFAKNLPEITKIAARYGITFKGPSPWA